MTADAKPPRLPREVRVTIADLEAIAYRASRLAKLLPDVHVIAYERERSGELVRGGTREGWYLDEQGRADAKEALGLVMAEKAPYGANSIAKALGLHVARIDALFSGPGADTSLRGTLLGDERGNGAQKEFTAALKAKDRREERGEYTPARTEPQPKRVPGA